jgi:hypothetical protein
MPKQIEMRKKVVYAKMVPDWVEPYKSYGNCIPLVTTSTHPRFVPGVRLDWGFVQVALEDGYRVIINPVEKSDVRTRKN